jgi:hypothetical protein
MDDREQALRQDGYLLGIATLGLVNGMHFSPLYDGAFVLLRPILATLFITSPVVQFYLSSLLLAVGSVLLAGIPAALYERATGRVQSDPTSLGIWLAGVGLLALPAFGRLFGVI